MIVHLFTSNQTVWQILKNGKDGKSNRSKQGRSSPRWGKSITILLLIWMWKLNFVKLNSQTKHFKWLDTQFNFWCRVSLNFFVFFVQDFFGFITYTFKRPSLRLFRFKIYQFVPFCIFGWPVTFRFVLITLLWRHEP